ncbi:ketol-acid reductoisomerase [Candidatus Roizmanbacteria bacterium RIFCSPLOWO2_01_FULL_38_12]|uniref:Ketol-acid reductoisomerase n=1 Tax=Candidatus Roizmanbacteria bacterium RIFCSPLOWO2_01_FULL_38_12 TaxID=1802061 RepID=A0A1F7IRB0_9BACT|nr:MAG: ketol-acid reductoisomerase [Candidatus Roizmanbacteria bacterium RIFCSPHIGHO2_01_FULL_38_15]OGK35413.1 MAG: ketol-acid reductoisomerase [Candidatus Roizmanbacteria bacterium RIFCSPHIGHO2_12_FULL_38_13]OGK45889.1 MAG: ketol-acid reductoisomerase [Candidatus Roizmanbacteria bacterium RIFCSPLOWO2_01_FULL_38_12]
MKINFGGVTENIVTRDELPLSKAKKILKNDVVAVLGYGVQGPGQALNMRDNGIKVIIGQRKESKSWNKAKEDGWVPGKTLFEIEEAAKRGTIIMYLLSDAGQKTFWPTLKPLLKTGKTLYFSHGFSITYKNITKVIPPKDIDVVLVAPKGSGLTVRRNFMEGSGINSSYAIFQDYSGRATEKCLALGIAVGSGYLFPTTFQKEVFSDLAGERGILIGALEGVFEAQYEELRKHGHSPSEAFNETVEELTQSLIKLVGEKGMDWMFANVSTTAQRGAFDWKDKFRIAVKPVFKELYSEVSSGREARRVLKKNSSKNYREELNEEIEIMRNHEMWKAGKKVRELRPENWKKTP